MRSPLRSSSVGTLLSSNSKRSRRPFHNRQRCRCHCRCASAYRRTHRIGSPVSTLRKPGASPAHGVRYVSQNRQYCARAARSGGLAMWYTRSTIPSTFFSTRDDGGASSSLQPLHQRVCAPSNLQPLHQRVCHPVVTSGTGVQRSRRSGRKHPHERPGAHDDGANGHGVGNSRSSRAQSFRHKSGCRRDVYLPRTVGQYGTRRRSKLRDWEDATSTHE